MTDLYFLCSSVWMNIEQQATYQQAFRFSASAPIFRKIAMQMVLYNYFSVCMGSSTTTFRPIITLNHKPFYKSNGFN